MVKRFENKVAIVTGSSNGIGRGIAVHLAELGAKVTITGRDTKALEAAKQEILATGAKESDIVVVTGDLCDEKVIHEIVDKTVAAFGGINILVNNAAGTAPDNTKEQGWEQTMECWDYVIRLNNRAVVQLTKLSMPYLIAAKGEVINISSICGYPFAQMHMPFYAASKGALDQMTRSLAAYYIRKGVRVNSVNPGIIETTLMEKQGISAERQKQAEDRMAKVTPIGRIAQSIEVAKVVAFLADRSQSEFIVGQCIVADGGSILVTPVLNAYDPTNFM